MNTPARLLALTQLYVLERDDARRVHDEATFNLEKATGNLAAAEERRETCMLHAQRIGAPGSRISLSMLQGVQQYMVACTEEVAEHRRNVEHLRRATDDAKEDLLFRQSRLKGLEKLKERRAVAAALDVLRGEQRELDRQAAELATELLSAGRPSDDRSSDFCKSKVGGDTWR